MVWFFVLIFTSFSQIPYHPGTKPRTWRFKARLFVFLFEHRASSVSVVKPTVLCRSGVTAELWMDKRHRPYSFLVHLCYSQHLQWSMGWWFPAINSASGPLFFRIWAKSRPVPTHVVCMTSMIWFWQTHCTTSVSSLSCTLLCNEATEVKLNVNSWLYRDTETTVQEIHRIITKCAPYLNQNLPDLFFTMFALHTTAKTKLSVKKRRQMFDKTQ